MKFNAGLLIGELPGDRRLRRIAAGFVGAEERAQSGDIGHPLGQTLAREDTQFELGHVEPTPMGRRVVEFELPHESARFRGREGLVECLRLMRAQVVEHHPDPLGGGIALIDCNAEPADTDKVIHTAVRSSPARFRAVAIVPPCVVRSRKANLHTLTLHRLNVFPELGVSLETTNLIESVMSRLEARTHRVTYWRTSDQKLRWCAAALWAMRRCWTRSRSCCTTARPRLPPTRKTTTRSTRRRSTGSQFLQTSTRSSGAFSTRTDQRSINR